MTRELAPGIVYDSEIAGYILMDAAAVIPPLQAVEIDGQLLEPKDEFHCSLVAARKLAKEDASQEREIVAVATDYIAKHALKITSLGSDIFVCRKPNDEGQMQATLITTVEIDGLGGLRDVLAKLLPDYSPPAPHVTLLKSRNSPYGIGVNSQADLVERCELRQDLVTQVFKQ